MHKVMPQQMLLLEVLAMSGDIAVANDIDATILGRTLDECRKAGWVSTTPFGAGFNKVTITGAGRSIVKGEGR